MTGDSLPVCQWHLKKYIDDPYWLADQYDYDAWFKSRGEIMSCHRCEGLQSDKDRDSVAIAFSQEDSAEGGRGTSGSRELDEQIVRQFDSYIKHPSNQD